MDEEHEGEKDVRSVLRSANWWGKGTNPLFDWWVRSSSGSSPVTLQRYMLASLWTANKLKRNDR